MVSLALHLLIKLIEFLNFSHFSSLGTLAHLLLYALYIGLKLYHCVLNAFFEIGSRTHKGNPCKPIKDSNIHPSVMCAQS